MVPSKRAIIDFVTRGDDARSAGFRGTADRIATIRQRWDPLV